MIKQFARLFAGLDRAHGEYSVDGKKKGAKATGRAKTVKEQVTQAHYELHLKGHTGLGIVPINDDDNCVFGAIDIDCYENFDPTTVERHITDNGWPLVVCRSKSGGAHVFMFTSEPVPASILKNKLKHYAIALGHPTAEIFPKQDKLASQDDIGNWINIPYFDADKTTRYGILHGESLDLSEFIQHAQDMMMSLRDLEELEVDTGEFADAPPCLEQLIMAGFPKGTMNNGLFNMGVYARMKFPDDWHRKVYEYNERFMGPGTPKEVQQILKSLDKKKYTYKCLEAPICGLCDKSICNQRDYGITSEHSPYKTTAAQKKMRPCVLDEVKGPVECFCPPEGSDDEPYWIFRINGSPMDVSIDMVSSQTKFLREYLKKFHKVALPIDETRWMIAINELLSEAVQHELAEDAGPEGHLFIHLENFLTGKVQARTKEELILGKPWRDKEDTEGNGDLIYFRSPDFIRYLDTQRFKQFKERQIYAILRRRGAAHYKFMLKGKCVAVWAVKPFDEQDGGFETPDVKRGAF